MVAGVCKSAVFVRGGVLVGGGSRQFGLWSVWFSATAATVAKVESLIKESTEKKFVVVGGWG